MESKKKKKTINNNTSIKQQTESPGESTQSSSFFFFNNDVVTEILTRLPTKTLIQSKLVCKSWLKLISTQSFKSKLKSLPPRLTGFFYANTKFHSFPTKIDNIGTQLDFTLSFINRNITVIDSHNGFILCAEELYLYLDRFHYLVANPLTKQWLALPTPCHKHHSLKKIRLFCYDNGFVVVSLLSCQDNVVRMEIYNSETNVWKELEILSTVFKRLPSHCFHDGCVYLWDVFGGNLCVYNLIEESCRFIELPVLENHYPATGLLGVSAEEVYYAVSNAGCFCVWVLVDGFEWCLKHCFSYLSLTDDLPEGVTSEFPLFALAFHPINYNLVVARLSRCKKVLLFHMDQRRIEVVNDIELSTSNQVISYWLPACCPPCLRST